jgi:5'-nucleotidase
MRNLITPLALLLASSFVQGQKKIVIGNDDGWAVAAIRAQFNALVNANYDVVLSCPAINLSGTGRLSAPIPLMPLLLGPCEFDSCPQFSPAEGFNASDPRLNYVNGFPVDAMKYGIETLAPKLLEGAQPDFAVSGPNVGNNLGIAVLGSGTAGAASAAALAGIPSVAFSGSSDSLSEVSYTTLDSNPTSTNTIASNLYAQLTVEFVDTLLSSSTSGPILPPGISLNVNYPSTANCSSVSDYSFVLTRLISDPFATDVETCGSTHLPAESDVVALEGCFSSVSVFNATTLLDVDSATQAAVLDRLGSFLTCAPSS